MVRDGGPDGRDQPHSLAELNVPAGQASVGELAADGEVNRVRTFSFSGTRI